MIQHEIQVSKMKGLNVRNITGQFRYTEEIKRYEYSETQQLRCIDVT